MAASSVSTASSLRDGQKMRIGEYQLVRRIGRGGMAEVWVARRRGAADEKYVAVKLMARHHARDERFERMFRAEAALCACLSHANIVQVFDAGEHGGRPYLVMEWVDGVTLAELEPWLWRLEPRRRLRIAGYVIGQVLHALDYAHRITDRNGAAIGIVHRDVSPHNILVSVSGEVKLTDFGIAHRICDQTSGKFIKGKLRYMPRDQVEGNGSTAAVDLYATGAILHELLDGRPFRHDATDDVALYAAIMSDSVPMLTEPAPAALEALRRGLLEPNRKRRLTSAARALDLLERWPDYVDMRRELGSLCASFLGVAGPRTGLLTHPPGGSLRPVDRDGLPSTDAGSPDVGTRLLRAVVEVDDEPTDLRRGPTEPTVTLPGPRDRTDGELSPRSFAGGRRRTLSLVVGLVASCIAAGLGTRDPAMSRLREWWSPWTPIAVREGIERPLAASSVAAPAPVDPPWIAGSPEADPVPTPARRGRVRRASPSHDEGRDPKPPCEEGSADVRREPVASARTGEPHAGTAEPLDMALVHVRLRGLESAEVRIGDVVREVGRGTAVRVPIGNHDLEWRRRASDDWNPFTMQVPPGEWVLRLGPEGARLVDVEALLRGP